MVSLSVLVLVLFAPAPEEGNPWEAGPPPLLARAGIKGDKLLVRRTWTKTRKVEVVVGKKVVDGKEVLETRLENETYFETIYQPVEIKGLRATDTEGNSLDAAALKRILQRWTTVAIATDERPVHEVYRKALQKGTPILILPGWDIPPGEKGPPGVKK
jgi:hypothetical protein